MSTHAPITPYVAARVATEVLGREVKEQTMFSLARRRRIATVKVSGSSKLFFDGNAFANWLRERKSNPPRSRTDYASLVQEFRNSVNGDELLAGEKGG